MQTTDVWIKEMLASDKHLKLTGKCHDCECEVEVLIDETQDGYEASLPVWKFDDIPMPFFKCAKCYEAEPTLKNYQPTEVYSRVVGYLRPVKQWNPGKQAEMEMRKPYVFSEKVLNSLTKNA
jgi:hypothetical protein